MHTRTQVMLKIYKILQATITGYAENCNLHERRSKVFKLLFEWRKINFSAIIRHQSVITIKWLLLYDKLLQL